MGVGGNPACKKYIKTYKKQSYILQVESRSHGQRTGLLVSYRQEGGLYHYSSPCSFAVTQAWCHLYAEDAKIKGVAQGCHLMSPMQTFPPVAKLQIPLGLVGLVCSFSP